MAAAHPRPVKRRDRDTYLAVQMSLRAAWESYDEAGLVLTQKRQ
jgi:hypothetical protein